MHTGLPLILKKNQSYKNVLKCVFFRCKDYLYDISRKRFVKCISGHFVISRVYSKINGNGMIRYQNGML